MILLNPKKIYIIYTKDLISISGAKFLITSTVKYKIKSKWYVSLYSL